MNKKKIFIIAGCIIALILIIMLFKGGSKANSIQIATAKAARNSISNSVTATGSVEPVTQVEVGTQVSGIIDKIYVDYNSEVTKGQLIAEMDRETLTSELRSTQADVATNKSELDYQTLNYNRIKTLHEKKLVADSEYESAQNSYLTAKNSYDRSLASLAKAKRNLSYATITSPIDGIVISRAVEQGQTVAAGFSTPTLFTIANDLTQMRVIADVDEADIGQVEEGQKVTFTVDAYPNDVFEGKVTQVRLEATTESNVVTYEVVISAYNPDLKLKPGLTANVTIVTMERNNVLTIPTKATRFTPDIEVLKPLKLTIQNNPEAEKNKETNKTRVVWVKKGNTLIETPITTGSTAGNNIEVESGLSEGDEVVTELKSGNTAAAGESSRNPFMPGPPDSNRKKSGGDGEEAGDAPQ